MSSTTTSPRNWRAVLSEINSEDDLLTNQGQKIYSMTREDLPLAVQKWRAAFGLCLWLGNGWTDIAWQHLDDLALGVAGFEDCGFELGAKSGREVIQVFLDRGMDPREPDFEDQYNNATEEMIDEIEGAVQKIDDRLISDIWDASNQLHKHLISHAKLIASPD